MLASKQLREISDSIVSELYMHELVARMQHKGFGLLIFILSVPFAHPLPSGGLSTIFGSLVALLGVQLMLQRSSLWLPKFISERKLDAKTGQFLIKSAEKFFSYVEKFVRPRMQWVVRRERILGFIIFVQALMLMLPIPIPFSNGVCSIPLLFLALALVEEDGVMGIIGFLFSFLSLAFHIAVFVLGIEGVKLLYERFWA